MDPSSAPPPLKNKLSHIKLLLEDANHRLRDEADIFTTKTSASAAMKPNQNGHTRHLSPNELRRTIADISTVQSVLSCPIFNQIANVTDSLDKLTYHLNLRPSIGPADIEFNDNGELVLAPPVEPTSLNNLINSQLDEYSNLPNSPQQQNNQIVTTNSIMGAGAVLPTVTGALTAQNGNNIEHQFNAQHQQQNASNYYTEFTKFHAQQQNNEMMSSSSGEASRGDKSLSDTLPCDQQNYIVANQPSQTIAPLHQHHHQQPPPPSSSSSSSAATTTTTTTQQRRSDYNTEKLLGADAGIGGGCGGGQQQATSNYANGARRPTKVQSVAAVFESAIAAGEANRGLYKANGHAALNQTTAQPNSADIRMDFETTRSMSQINEQSMGSDSSQTLGYTNEMYKAAHEIASAGNLDPNFKSGVYANGEAQQQQQQQPTNGKPTSGVAGPGERVAQNGKVVSNQQPLSPATSAGSNAKLIDECDSGTSSFRSKGALYSPQPQKLMEQTDEEPIDSSIDQELIEKLSPEMERIKVTLEKDTSGLGITIAGYTCEQEEISGIFIKSITPGSPADRSGKIRILDQIFAVNAQDILGYSNPDAVNVLRRQTSKIVTLDLMRYLAESKYKKLQTLLEHAEPSANLQQKSQMLNSSSSSSDAVQPAKAQPVVSTSSPKQVEPQQQQQPQRQQQQHPVESMYNNTQAFIAQKPQDGATSPIPVAAQRTAPTSKVIETKQGARNTINIRSPLVQATAMATYVNAADPAVAANNSTLAQCNPKSVPDRLRQEFQFSEEFCHLEKLEWAKNVEIVELRRESTQSLGFTIKDYANPKDSQQSIFMIVSITPGGIADQSGQLSIGDLLMFVDDTPLENSTLIDAVKALRRTSDQVRLGILKYMRN